MEAFLHFVFHFAYQRERRTEIKEREREGRERDSRLCPVSAFVFLSPLSRCVVLFCVFSLLFCLSFLASIASIASVRHLHSFVNLLLFVFLLFSFLMCFFPFAYLMCIPCYKPSFSPHFIVFLSRSFSCFYSSFLFLCFFLFSCSFLLPSIFCRNVISCRFLPPLSSFSFLKIVLHSFVP